MRITFILLIVVAIAGVSAESQKVRSQIETTTLIKDIVRNFDGLDKPKDLEALRFIMMYNLEVRQYTKRKRRHERKIRWRRTATEIFEDGFVYSDQGEADLVIAYVALCKALGVRTRYVTLWRDQNLHTVAEVALGKAWFIYDVAGNDTEPVEGIITKRNGYGGWKLWRKGRDAWDIGLRCFNDRKKLCEDFNCGSVAGR